MDFYNKEIKDIYKELDSKESGLTSSQVEDKLQKYGYNKFEERKKESNIIKFLNQFKDLMIIVLLIIAIFLLVYGILYTHEYTDSIIIFIVVTINAIIGYVQEKKAEVTLEGLKKYNISTCTVLRDGKEQIIDSNLLVPGDVIFLEAGDLVPADCRIISESFLSVDESSLTGESLAVKKNTKVLTGKCLIQERNNMIFSSTSITSGRVSAIVVYTGMNTEIGKIASSLNTPYKVPTPLELKITEITNKLSFIIFIIVLFIFLYSVLILKSSVLEIIFLCVSLAVAAIPEGLPAVITISLSIGAGDLAKKKTIVKQIRSIETIGTTDIICSDKTGTITQNKMTVEDVVEYDKKMLQYVALLCNDTKVIDNKFIGDPTETCMFEYLNKSMNVFNEYNKYKRIMDFPFDSNRKMMSTINNINDKTYILVKGSLDSIISNSKYIIKDNKKVKLTKDIINEIRSEEERMAKKALRVITCAYKEISDNNINDIYNNENELIIVGLIGMIDPPREDVKKSVELCKKAGIRPIMLTGDSLLTASEIAKNVGILNKGQKAVLGSDIDEVSDEDLIEFVKDVSVYARVSPDHKRRIVAAWQKQDKVVAMTGDGVNDAPAIKDAHVGVGMGITGTEVTKSVADIIILDDSFSTIVVAVNEGRNIYNNIRNNIIYSLSSNFSEIFTILIAMFAKVTILLPIHILFINLLTDSIPCICLAYEKNGDQMDYPPRGLRKPLFTPFVNAYLVVSSLICTSFVVATYFILNNMFDSQIAMTGTLLTMVIQEIIYSYSCRNIKKSILEYGIFSNKAFNIGISILIFIEILFFATPLGKVLSIVPLGAKITSILLISNLLAFALYEIFKLIINKVFKD